jgi:predicted GIY-YIG superfamily endonuclease
MIWYVYILQLSNWKYYIWSTRNYEERLQKHTIWWVQSTLKYLPFALKICKQYTSYYEAYAIERRLKKSKSRKIIEQYIENSD